MGPFKGLKGSFEGASGLIQGRFGVDPSKRTLSYGCFCKCGVAFCGCPYSKSPTSLVSC